MHALSEEFDATELRRARASLEMIDLRALELGPDELRSASTTSERVTHLHIPVPAITRGTLARTHELKKHCHFRIKQDAMGEYTSAWNEHKIVAWSYWALYLRPMII